MRTKIIFTISCLILLTGIMLIAYPVPSIAGYLALNDGLFIYRHTISPDGKYLVGIMGRRTSSGTVGRQLYLIDLQTGDRRTLTNEDSTLQDVMWLPEGNGLLLLRSTGSSYLHTLSLISPSDGSEQVLTTIDNRLIELSPENLIVTESGYGYLYENEVDSYRTQLFTVTIPTGESAPITEIETLPEGGVWNYLISPNQKYVAMQYYDTSYPADSHLIFVDLATGERQILLTMWNRDDEVRYKFSPNSRYLLYHHYDSRAAKDKFFQYEIETGLSEMIDEQPIANNFAFDFSTDGKYVFFTDYDGSQFFYLSRYEMATRERFDLHRSKEFFWNLYVAPNNEHVLLAIRRDVGTELLSVRYNPPNSTFTLVPNFNPNDNLIGDTFSFSLHGWLVYRNQGSETGDWLYAVPLDGSESAHPIYPEPIVRQFLLDPSGTKVYYLILHHDKYTLVTEPIIQNKEGPSPLYKQIYADQSPYIRSIMTDGRVLFEQYPNYYIADSLPPTLNWGSANTMIEEGGNQNVTVTLDSATAVGTITIPIEVIGGSATEGVDYSLPNQLIIPPGATVDALPIDIIADGQSEVTETIILQLGNPTGARLGEPRVITITVYDELFRQALPLIEQ